MTWRDLVVVSVVVALALRLVGLLTGPGLFALARIVHAQLHAEAEAAEGEGGAAAIGFVLGEPDDLEGEEFPDELEPAPLDEPNVNARS